jgi:hypothetical protein
MSEFLSDAKSASRKSVGAVPPCRHIFHNESTSSARQRRRALPFLIKGRVFKRSEIIVNCYETDGEKTPQFKDVSVTARQHRNALSATREMFVITGAQRSRFSRDNSDSDTKIQAIASLAMTGVRHSLCR